MSASLDRKIEAARLRAEAERKQAGGPAAPEEVAAFESARAVGAPGRAAMSDFPRTIGEYRKLFEALWNEGADAPMMEADEGRKVTAAHGRWLENKLFAIMSPPAMSPPVIFEPARITAADLPSGWFRYRDLLKRPILSWQTGKDAEMQRREKTLREMPPPPHGDPLLQRSAVTSDADALQARARKAADETDGGAHSIKAAVLKTLEPLILEIAELKAAVARLSGDAR